MIELIRPLFRHQEWADDALLRAAGEHGEAARDTQLRSTLHHVVTVQRAFLSLFLQWPFDLQKELQLPGSLADVGHRFVDTHREEMAFVAALEESDLARVIEVPWFPGLNPSLAEALTQVVMHSQNHRGQCLARLRALGATPPALDFIVWLKEGCAAAEIRDRPRPGCIST
jgi:uncharacterized damage-inducible protein DinB